MAKRDANGQEAPMVITPRALLHAVKLVVEGIRRAGSRWRTRD
jgi:hypothetical protein